MANVVFLWHMHQPYYVNPLTRVAMMPWVRLHCVKGYLDMISVIADYPAIKLNFNLTPVLLLQIEEIVEGRVTDLWLERSRMPASDLDGAAQLAILKDFFKANLPNMVYAHPRFAELLLKRGEHYNDQELPRIARRFSAQDFLDLQVWFNLTWCGYTARARYPEIAALIKKGRHFTESEKARLLEIHLEIMRSIPLAYHAAEERGQIELTTTPFFHPILPLIYDTAFAERSLPEREFPHRYHWPQDAEAQLTLAIKNHARLFGRRPRGLWPSEGSIAPEMIPLMQQAGIQYFCSDEENLFHSIRRDPLLAQAKVDHLELFQGWRIQYDGAAVNGIFRDRPLSDFIGFTASRNEPAQASRHLVGLLQHIADRIPPEQGLIPVILDGENAWEHFPDGGEAFLRALYKEIGSDPARLRSCTIENYLQNHPPIRTLATLHTGSWIGSNFDIWIGEPEENRAWDLLGETRAFLQSQIDTGQLDKKTMQEALLEIYAAEGSDWFWWYGPDFSTENDALFDALFRQHLKNVYLLCGVAAPQVLDVPIKGFTPPLYRTPQRRISPWIGDGDESSRLEWFSAGTYLPGAEQGTMHRGDRLVKKIWFGCDAEHFYLRLDFACPAQKPPISFLLFVTHPENGVVAQAQTSIIHNSSTASFIVKNSQGKAIHRSTLSIGENLEWKLSLRDLGISPGNKFAFQLSLYCDGMERERYPEHAAIPITA